MTNNEAAGRVHVPIPNYEVAVPFQPLTRGNGHYFFGYYDKSPWDASGRYILAHKVDFFDHMPKSNDVATVGIIDREHDDTFIPLAKTTAWSWQQGAMTQWVPALPDTLIFNDRRDEKFVAVLFNIRTRTERVLPLPIYCLSPDGKYALSVDFTILALLRPGYGYASASAAPGDLAKTGVFRIDLHTHEVKLLISYQQIANFEAHPVMSKANHWIEHVLFSPDSHRFICLHRFSSPGTFDGAFYSRLVTADLNGADLHVLLAGMVSHFCWANPHQILAWARNKSLSIQLNSRRLINRIGLRWVVRFLRARQTGWLRHSLIGDNFVLFTDKPGESHTIGAGVLLEDGHPTYSSDGRWILLDTYPDSDSYRNLYLYNIEKNEKVMLGRFYSSPEFSGGIRSDLHPRWNRDCTEVCIDSAHDGTRRMYVLDVRSIVL